MLVYKNTHGKDIPDSKNAIDKQRYLQLHRMQSMSQIRPSTRLEASKAPRWRIWVPDLKDICHWVNIWKPASKDPGLKSWLKLRFWTWSVTKNIDFQKKTLLYAKKSMTLWENYPIAIKKACTNLIKTCISSIFQHIYYKENSRSPKISSWLIIIRF